MMYGIKKVSFNRSWGKKMVLERLCGGCQATWSTPPQILLSSYSESGPSITNAFRTFSHSCSKTSGSRTRGPILRPSRIHSIATWGFPFSSQNRSSPIPPSIACVQPLCCLPSSGLAIWYSSSTLHLTPPVTKYDDSPEAYEAYILKQNKIAQSWVSNIRNCRISFYNPVHHPFQSLCALGLTIR